MLIKTSQEMEMYPYYETESAQSYLDKRQIPGSDYRSTTGVKKHRMQAQMHESNLHQLLLHSAVGVLHRNFSLSRGNQ